MLHITNGDSTRLALEPSGVPGTFWSYPDVLHDGPTPGGLSPQQWRAVRARHLSTFDGSDPNDLLARYEKDDAVLDSWREHDEVVFWFEHDLYDQLLLIRHLWWLRTQGAVGAQGALGAGTGFSLVCGDTYLGLLKPEAFPALFAARRAITPAQIDLGSRAWEAFCAAEPEPLLCIWRGDTSALPFLAAALQRHFEDYPWTRDGLSRSERQILEVVRDGESSPAGMFRAWTRREATIFMGDSIFWTIALRLSRSRVSPIAVDTAPFTGRLPEGTVTLTSFGRELLEGEANQIGVNGIDRWMGGVHLTSGRVWRWDPDERALV